MLVIRIKNISNLKSTDEMHKNAGDKSDNL